LGWHLEAKKQWDSSARKWAEQSQNMWENGSRQEIIPFIMKHIPKSATFCDLGCGDGYGTFKLYKNGYQPTGLDISETMIEIARKNTTHSSISFVQGDISCLPFEKQQFQAAMVINSLEWTENPLIALKEIERILIPGGFACIGILGPTATPRKVNSFPRLYGETVIMNSMLPWEFERLALENGWALVDERWIKKEKTSHFALTNLPKELQQALSFMWLFMFKTPEKK